ncbi:MAG: putative DNA binding domain-containing protein [Pyrinomonadaceae bacterium]|nr:putative DNA binding domain-containing protein [Pyrinomonadaceae bacterium]
MSRKKFRRSQRFEPTGDRSFQEYIINTPAPPTTRSELLRLIRGGEDTYLELKVKLSNSERVAQEIIAIANTAGGVMIFGVSDQLRIEGVNNPEGVQEELVKICREEIYPPLIPLLDCISFDNGRRIVVLDIDPKRRPYRTKDGRFYLRIGAEKRESTREELSDLLEETRPVAFEDIPVQTATEDDFDDGILWSFAEAFDDEFLQKNLYQTVEFLKRDLVLALGEGDEFRPTVAAVLLFGKSERVGEIVPRSGITATRYSGNSSNFQIVETHELNGNLLTLYESSMRFIKRFCDLEKFRPKRSVENSAAPVEPRKNYHIYAVREGIINALIHRDLALRDGETRINVFDDSIEIINPRRTNGFVPPSSRAIRFGITQAINPQIAAIFKRREYGTNVPRGGIPMILKQSRLFSGRRAEIYTSGDEFKLKIFGF